MRLRATRLSAVTHGGNTPSVISGFAYPSETLTSTRAGQWYVDGVAVSGQTGNTFVVPLLAYGRSVTCGNSAPVIIWKPWDIAGVVSVRVADRRVLSSVSPDVVATNGQAVRRWEGLVSSFQANQTTGTNQPLYRSAGESGNPSVEFDGTNDRLDISGSELSIFQNVGTAYIIAGLRDTNPTAGSVFHIPIGFSDGTSPAFSRLSIQVRYDGINFSRIAGSRLDGTGTSTAGVAINGNYNVHVAEGLYSSGSLRHRINGAQVGTAAISSGNTSNTPSISAQIGMFNNNSVTGFPGHICCLILANQLLSATDRSRLERFAGLFGNLNIPLV